MSETVPPDPQLAFEPEIPAEDPPAAPESASCSRSSEPVVVKVEPRKVRSE